MKRLSENLANKCGGGLLGPLISDAADVAPEVRCNETTLIPSEQP